MSDEKKATLLARREALQLLGLGLGAASLLVAGRSEAADEKLSCKDKAPIDANSKNLRKALQYKEKSDNAEKICSKCAQFEGGKFGDCGACKLFTGAVNPNGGCLSFAPMAK